VDIVYAGFDRNLHVWDMPYPYHPWATPWPTFHANARRTGVFLEDIVTAVASAEFELHPGAGAIAISSYLVGTVPADLRLRLDRQEVRTPGEQPFVRVADELRVQAGTVAWTDHDVREGSTYRYRLSDASGVYSFTSPAVTVPVLHLTLSGNQPNPFNPSTTITFEVPGSANAPVPTLLDVYDLAGRRVRRLLAEPVDAGRHEARWDGKDDGGRSVSSGVYVARLQAAGESRTLKMTLVK
jgi:hypothetical protein